MAVLDAAFLPRQADVLRRMTSSVIVDEDYHIGQAHA